MRRYSILGSREPNPECSSGDVIVACTSDFRPYQKITYVTGFVKIDPNHTGTEIHFIAEH